MDVDKFLREGNVAPNPDYNPKTKKGAKQAPFLVDYDAGNSISDRGASAVARGLGRIGYDLNDTANENYADYDVYAGPTTDKDTLDKERANNQSGLAKTMNMIGQTINEVTLGTAEGIIDLGTIAYNGIMNDPYASNQLKDAVSRLREEIDANMPIYRRNPNEAFDFGDYGYIMSQLPQLASSVTLMVPGMGVTKAAGLVGKALRVEKGFNKVANAFKWTEKTREMIEAGVKSSTTGLTMRMIENYQEAEQTFGDVKSMAAANLSVMDDKQRASFYKNNPQYDGMSDEDVAQDIAVNSADVTFNANWGNAIFDIAQVYSLKNLYRKALSTPASTGVSNFNKFAAENFKNPAGALVEEYAKVGTKDKIIRGAKNIMVDTFKGTRAEWTEGLEEGLNYVAGQEGLYHAAKVFDKDADVATFQDYLKDPHLWESAMWGVLGGVVFSGAMEKGRAMYNKRLNKEWIAAEEQKKQEILSRKLVFEQYIDRLKSINDNKNPYFSENGKPIEVGGEADLLRKTAENEFMEEVALNALNAGNVDLLKEYATNNGIKQGFKDQLGLDDQQTNDMQQRFVDKIDEVYDVYNNTINIVNRVGGNLEIGKMIATKNARALTEASRYKALQYRLESIKYAETNKAGVNLQPNDVSDIQSLYKLNAIQELENQKKEIAADATISRSTKAKLLSDIEYQLNNPMLSNVLLADDNANANAERVAKEYPTLYKAIINDMDISIKKAAADKQVSLSVPDITKQVKEYNSFINNAKDKIVSGALKDLNNMFNSPVVTPDEIYGYYANGTEITDAPALMSKLDNIKKILQLSDEDVDNNRLRRMYIMSKLRQDNKAKMPVATTEESDEDMGVEPVVEAPQPVVTPPTGDQTKAHIDEAAVMAADLDAADPLLEQPEVVEDSPEVIIEQEPAVEPAAPEVVNENAAPNKDTNIEEYIKALEQLVNSAYAEMNLDSSTSTATDRDAALETIIANAVEAGFEKDDVIEAYDSINMLFHPDSYRYSNITDNDRIMLVNSGIVIGRPVDDASRADAIQAILDAYIADNGVTINGKSYLSIEQLVSYLYNKTGSNKLISDYLFADMKYFLYNSTLNGGKYVLTDDASIKNMSNAEFSDVVRNNLLRRLERSREIYNNNVNIINEANPDSFAALTGLTVGDDLSYKVDKKLNRIYIATTDNKELGYIGIPRYDSKSGVYSHNNMGWNYDIQLNENGTVSSELKDFVIDTLITNPDTALLEALYEAAFNTDGDVSNEELSRINDILASVPGASKFYVNTDNNMHIKHLINITKYAFRYDTNQERSINQWFSNLATSYAQAYSVSNNEVTGSFKAANIRYGAIALDDTAINNIDEAAIDYDENIHQLGIITSRNDDVQFSNENTPRNIKGFSNMGVTILSIPNGNGGFAYAQCNQLYAGDESISKDAKEIVAASKQELYNILSDFIRKDTSNSFDDVADRLKSLFGNNALFSNVNIVRSDSGANTLYINFNTKDPNTKTNNDKSYGFIVNSNKYGRNVVFNNELLGDDFKLSANSNLQGVRKTNFNAANEAAIREAFNEIADRLFASAKFGIPFIAINDKLKNDKDVNRYIRRVNGKTVIEIGDTRKEYKSYQDYLVSNKLLKTKLTINDNAGTKSNWLFDPKISKLDITLGLDEQSPVEEAQPVSPVTPLLSNVIYETTTPDRILATATNTGFTQSLEQVFSYDVEATAYLNKLQTMGIIPNDIQFQAGLTDANGNKVNGLYNRTNDSVVINSDLLGDVSYDRLVRIVIHESLHQQLNKVYNVNDALAKVADVYNQFKTYVEGLPADSAAKATLSPYLFSGLDTNTALEEFLVESITSYTLMDALNNIDSNKDNVSAKGRKNLFKQLIEAIADILGIDIRKGSLLEEEFASLKNIRKVAKSKPNAKTNIVTDANRDNAQGVIEFNDDAKTEDLTAVPEQNATNAQAFDIDSDLFSVLEDGTPSIKNFISGKPLAIQGSLRQMLVDGDLNFYCR